MKRASGNITLALLGVVLIGGCDREVETRDVYASKGDCVQDWGETKCEAAPPDQRTGGISPFFYGPAYIGARSALQANHQSRAVTSQNVVRGGFGASASAHSSSST